MTPREFVQMINQVVLESTVATSLSILQHPPGRRPPARLLVLSEWFNQLSQADKARVREVVELTGGQCVFGLLAVLDGVRQVESSASKGLLELRYLKDGHSQLLNDPDGQPLHDILNEIVPPV